MLVQRLPQLWCWSAAVLLTAGSHITHASETKSVQRVHTGEHFPQGALQSGLRVQQETLTLAPMAATSSYVSPIVVNDFSFNAIGPHWHAQLPEYADLKLYVRVSIEGEHWGDWIFVPQEEGPIDELTEGGRPNPFAGDQTGALVFVHPESRFVQYRFDFIAGPQGSPRLRRMALQLINSMEGPSLEPAGHAPDKHEQNAHTAAVPKPKIYKRAEWGARSPSSGYLYTRANHIGFHHTAGVADFNVGNLNDCAARVRAIQAYHMDSNGWIDIGYNYAICKHGHIFQAREDDNDANDVHGAHDGFNAGSMGVSTLGYFHAPYNQQPTPEMLHALQLLMAWKCDERNIDPKAASLYAAYGAVRDNIYGHREVRATACPGDILFTKKQAIRDSVAQIIRDAVTGVHENTAPLPLSFQLLQSYPNPFSASAPGAPAKIIVNLPSPETAELAIYNTLGQRVRLLQNRFMPAGQHEVFWEGRNEEGRQQAAGLYFVRLTTSTQTQQIKLLLVK